MAHLYPVFSLGNPFGSAAGCRTVYLDLGANVGVRVRQLYEPELYPQAKTLPVYNEYLGPPDERRQPCKKHGDCALCVWSFEANPQQMPRLNAIESAYRSRGWLRTKFFNMAVADRSGEAKIFLNDGNGDQFNNWDASMVYKPKQNSSGRSFSVKKLDLALFMQHVIVPAKPRTVLVKMDIEGMEYLVLPQLLKNGLLCSTGGIARILIEWHGNRLRRGRRRWRRRDRRAR